MEYKGRYNIFNQNLIETFPVDKKLKKVSLNNILKPSKVRRMNFNIAEELNAKIEKVAEHIISYRKKNKPVIFFTGAHLIKNGLGLLLIDLLNHDIITLVAGNCATAIHDFELALVGRTSENVPQALKEGKFGMASEFSIMNHAISLGDRYKLGLGESLGKMICERSYFNEVLDILTEEKTTKGFKYPQYSVLATSYKKKIPFTIHVGIGTDIIDQHPNFDGCSKGGCSARDFLIFVNEVTKLVGGGVVLNIGSAVTGPEVLLKAVSMVSNIGKPPNGIITANFDLREEAPLKGINEFSSHYYFRDQKSVVLRIPQAFNGKSFYIKGDQRETIPLLYKKLLNKF